MCIYKLRKGWRVIPSRATGAEEDSFSLFSRGCFSLFFFSFFFFLSFVLLSTKTEDSEELRIIRRRRRMKEEIGAKEQEAGPSSGNGKTPSSFTGYPGRGSRRLAEIRYLFLRPSFPPFLRAAREETALPWSSVIPDRFSRTSCCVESRNEPSRRTPLFVITRSLVKTHFE